jgi:hypothetical protein
MSLARAPRPPSSRAAGERYPSAGALSGASLAGVVSAAGVASDAGPGSQLSRAVRGPTVEFNGETERCQRLGKDS